MGPARLCLTQHVSLQTSDLSAQPGGQQRPHCHSAEHRGSIQSSRLLFSHRGAQRGDHPAGQDALGTVGSRNGLRSSHPLQCICPYTGPREQPGCQHPLPACTTQLCSSNPGFRRENHQPATGPGCSEVLRAHTLLQS